MTFEIIDHGEDHAQYFSGCGVAHTDFRHVVTGCGLTFAEAFEDALEQAIDCAHPISNVDADAARAWAVENDPEDGTPPDEWPHEEWWRYVSIRW